MKIKKYKFLLISLAVLLLVGFMAPQLVQAYKLEFSPWMLGAGFSGEQNPTLIAGTVIGIVLTFLGLIFLVLVIYAGFILAFAGGSDEKVLKARKVLAAAVIGLVVTLSAYGIAFLIFSKLPAGGTGGAGTCTGVGGTCAAGSCHHQETNYGQRNCASGQTCCGDRENGCTDEGGTCYSGCDLMSGYCEASSYCQPGYEKNYMEGCPSGQVCCVSPGAAEECPSGGTLRGWQGCGSEHKCCLPAN